MSYDTAHSLASSWVGLFPAVWFARNAHRIEETARLEHDEQLGRRARSRRPSRRRNRRRFVATSGDFPDPITSSRRTITGAGEPRRADAEAESDEVLPVAARSVQPELDDLGELEAHGPSRCERVDLFPARPARTDSRFDQTVALPIDAPHALDATIRALVLRLRALPDLHELAAVQRRTGCSWSAPWPMRSARGHGWRTAAMASARSVLPRSRWPC